MGQERRKNTRVPFRTTADVQFANKKYTQCETENLSIKGVSVLGIAGHQAGEQCDISLALSGSTSELKLTMQGEIVRVQDDSIGLKFTEIDLDSFYHLKNIIYYNSEDPDKIETELAKSLTGP
jgi:hypothetical protein